MITTVEHRLILNPDKKEWRELGSSAIRIQQGFLVIRKNKSVYVSLENADKATLCFRIENLGIPDVRYKMPIPRLIGNILFWLSSKRVIKRTRHQVHYAGRTWRVNEFSGKLRGLLLVEIALEPPDEISVLPEWALADVSMDKKYTFAELAQNGIPKKSPVTKRV